MSSQPSRSPRFNVGDPVLMTAPGRDHGKNGVVTEIVESSGGDFVYRYRVRFLDGSSGKFFGFELELRDSRR